MQRAGDRGSGQGQHIHAALEVFDLLLVAHPEALLLVDDQKAQVLKLHPGGQQLVGADDHIHPARLEPFQDLRLLLGGLEAGEEGHVYREAGKAGGDGIIVLLGQDGGGHQHGHLLAGEHRLKGGPQGHLGFAVAHVPAQ